MEEEYAAWCYKLAIAFRSAFEGKIDLLVSRFTVEGVQARPIKQEAIQFPFGPENAWTVAALLFKAAMQLRGNESSSAKRGVPNAQAEV